jgi:tRNA isopentenyl-2-thiomethyl-A-37 hydroxylase MiaE
MRTEKEIAKDIKALVERYAIESGSETDKFELKSMIMYMIHVVENELFHAKQVLEDAKEMGLSITQIETEGYVRACLIIKDEFNRYSDELSAMIKEVERE